MSYQFLCQAELLANFSPECQQMIFMERKFVSVCQQGHKKALQVLLKLQGAFLIYIGYTISSYLVLQQVEECYVQVLRRPVEME